MKFSTRKSLTPRETEIIELVAKGMSAAEIAERLGIGPCTVRTHIEHIKIKLDAKNTAEAVAKYINAKNPESLGEPGN